MDASWKMVARGSQIPTDSSSHGWLAAFYSTHCWFCRVAELWHRPSAQSPVDYLQVRRDFFCDFPADFQPELPSVWGNSKPFTFPCILNASVMNGVTQTQTQRSKLPASPVPVNASPGPPAQKLAPGHPHPSNPPTRPNQHANAQPAPNRGQPPANAQHPKNKKKSEPTPVDPAVMYESVVNRIAALEEEETHEEEEERRFGTSFTTFALSDV